MTIPPFLRLATAVVGRVPMFSPWRVLMVGRCVGDLVTNDLVASLFRTAPEQP